MDISLNLNSTQNSLDVLKYSILYFDKVTVDFPFVVEDVIEVGRKKRGKTPCKIIFTPYSSKIMRETVNYLEKEEVLYQARRSPSQDYHSIAKSIVGANLNLLFDSAAYTLGKDGHSASFMSDTKIASEEALDALNEIITDELRENISKYKFNGFPVPDFYLAFCLYESLLADLLSHLYQNDNVLCNSMVLNSMLCNMFSNADPLLTKNYMQQMAKMNALEILLPNIREASIDDILETKYLAKDELIEMRSYIDSTIKDLEKANIFESADALEIRRIIEGKIIPAIRQFERKLQDIKLESIQSFIHKLQNPLSYAPLITSFFSDTPVSVTFGASLGIIAIESLIEYKQKKNEIRNNPLYFTVAMSDYR